MIALSEAKKEFKAQLLLLSALFISLLVIFKIVLFKETLVTLFLALGVLFYSIIIPGVILLAYLNKKLGSFSRLVLGSVLAIALTGIASYYLGLLGLHVKYHPYIIPPLIMLVGLFLFYRENRYSQNL